MKVARHDGERRAVPLERGDDFRPVADTADQAIETMDDDSIHLPCSHALKESLQRRPIHGRPALAKVIEALLVSDPALERVRADALKAHVPLGVTGREVVVRAGDRLARVDGARSRAPLHLPKLSRVSCLAEANDLY